MSSKFIAGLDLGNRFVRAVMVEETGGERRPIASAQLPSRGIRAQQIVSMPEATEVVGAVLDGLVEQAGAEPDALVCAVGGRHASSTTTFGVAPVRSGIVTERDLSNVEASAREGVVPHDRSELHLLVDSYRVGANTEISRPVGMHGRRLELWGRLISAERNLLQNLERCVAASGRSVSQFGLGLLATADSFLLPEERDGSVVLLDIGASCTEVVAYSHGRPVHIGLVALGGDHLTADLVDALRTPFNAADRIKRDFGAVHESLATSDRIEMPSFGDGPTRAVEQRILCDVLTPRAEELLLLVLKELERAGIGGSPSFGFVLAGGGALLKGMKPLATELLGTNVRLATAIDTAAAPLLDTAPGFATALGLARGHTAYRRRLTARFGDWFQSAF